jgi:uncharacterized protein (UPF0548 family)
VIFALHCHTQVCDIYHSCRINNWGIKHRVIYPKDAWQVKIRLLGCLTLHLPRLERRFAINEDRTEPPPIMEIA